MTSFLSFILNKIIDSFPLILIGVTAALISITIFYFCKRTKEKHPPEISWFKVILTVIMFAYIAMLFSTTLAGRDSTYAQYANFHLFRAWRDAWNNFSQQSWLNVLINIAMFSPLGIMLPFLSRKFRTWYWPLIAGLVLSTLIEATQYLTGIGLMDVDDIFCNSLGAFLGGCISLSITALLESGALKWRRFILYISMPLIFIFSVSGIFAAYHFKEYGNILEAPSYRQNVRNAEWVLSCELGDKSEIVPVYESPQMIKAEADIFAEDFARKHSFNFSNRSYSDYTATYHDAGSGASLFINFTDGTYIYEKNQNIPDYYQSIFTKTQVLEALSEFDINIPDGAKFFRDEQQNYIFEADKLGTADGMYIGSVSCILSDNCEVEKLYMYMVKCSEVGHISIDSEAKAYDRLTHGDFSGPEWFPGESPDNYEITSCELRYGLDSKGYYRPVYVFSALIDGHEVGNGLLVLAN